MPKIGDIVGGKKLGYKSTNRYIWSACFDCGKKRWVILRREETTQRRCRSCVMKRIQQGRTNNQWKGGRVKDGKGYILIWANPTSPYYSMRNRNYILEHRLVMAKHLGRCLKSWEIVHHKNHIRDDNRIENLELHKISDHQAMTILEEENKRLKMKIKELEIKINEKE